MVTFDGEATLAGFRFFWALPLGYLNGTTYTIDPVIAGIMLIRRDANVEDWSNPKADQYGIKATTRFGLGILRSNAIAK